VHAYEQWGVECLQHFRGMFAFAIIDENKKHYFLACDHFGIKPVFYRTLSEGLAFCSEIHGIATCMNESSQGSLRNLDSYLQYQYISAPDTIYKNVFQLKPGNYIYQSFNASSVAQKEYYFFNFKKNNNKISSAEIEEQLKESVKSHLVADVPFGVFLSGGIDSTLVAIFMQQLLEKPVKAFSIGYKNASFSELPYAQHAAKELGIELIYEEVEDTSLDILPDLVAHYGQPYADRSAIPTYYVSKLARKHVPMVLSGDGGDEFFAGYNRYAQFKKRRQLPAQTLGLLKGKSYLFMSKALAYNELQSILAIQERNTLWKKDVKNEYQSILPEYGEVLKKFRGSGSIQFAQYADIHSYLTGDILTKVDVASMMHGLEVRTP
jgi:asparagine synthase (glutamine-hydrolysing)